MRPASWLERYGLRALVVIAYVSVFPYSPAINSPNENVRVYMTRALVEHHELAINKIESEWGWVKGRDKAKNGTRVFSGKAPGVSVFGVPVLAAQTWLWHRFGWPSPSQLATTLALRLFAVILPMCGFLSRILCGYLRRVVGSSGFADLLFAGVALGHLMYPYAIHFVGHSLAAATSFGAFMVLIVTDREITSSRSRIALAGLLAGLGVLSSIKTCWWRRCSPVTWRCDGHAYCFGSQRVRRRLRSPSASITLFASAVRGHSPMPTSKTPHFRPHTTLKASMAFRCRKPGTF